MIGLRQTLCRQQHNLRRRGQPESLYVAELARSSQRSRWAQQHQACSFPEHQEPTRYLSRTRSGRRLCCWHPFRILFAPPQEVPTPLLKSFGENIIGKIFVIEGVTCASKCKQWRLSTQSHYKESSNSLQANMCLSFLQASS